MLGLIARKLKPALVLVGFGIRKSFDVKKALGILRRYMAAYRKDNPKVAFLWLATHAQGCRKPARYRLMQNNDAVLAYNAAMERELRRYVPVPAPACHRPLAHRATLARQSVAMRPGAVAVTVAAGAGVGAGWASPSLTSLT